MNIGIKYWSPSYTDLGINLNPLRYPMVIIPCKHLTSNFLVLLVGAIILVLLVGAIILISSQFPRFVFIGKNHSKKTAIKNNNFCTGKSIWYYSFSSRQSFKGKQTCNFCFHAELKYYLSCFLCVIFLILSRYINYNSHCRKNKILKEKKRSSTFVQMCGVERKIRIKFSWRQT